MKSSKVWLFHETSPNQLMAVACFTAGEVPWWIGQDPPKFTHALVDLEEVETTYPDDGVEVIVPVLPYPYAYARDAAGNRPCVVKYKGEWACYWDEEESLLAVRETAQEDETWGPQRA